jgi:hypothetical protein
VHRQLPEAHCVPTGQLLPQVPQLFASKLRLTQAPLQSLRFVGQDGAHIPKEHAPGGHVTPQAPQFVAFEARSTHWPSQRAGFCPTAHWQPPALHSDPATHVFPQKPQLFGSEASVVHLPKQATWLGAHVTGVQTPALQKRPTGQVAPHAPQLVRLVARSTHWPLHWAGRWPRHPHLPETH